MYDPASEHFETHSGFDEMKLHLWLRFEKKENQIIFFSPER